MTDEQPAIAATAFLSRLAARGVEYVFANAGTDFAPIVEAIARETRKGHFPQFIVVPHENLAVAMAHGYYRLSGKPAAVMCHVTVGTANALCNLMNCARDNVPILLAAGRTPNTELGHSASRNGYIHWGTESFDQGGIVREYVKWDYEWRHGQPAADLVDRALDIAMSEPRGPVYLTLPREVLGGPVVEKRRYDLRPLGASPPHPSPDAVERAAAMLANAEFPLVITATAGRKPEAFPLLTSIASRYSLGVVQPQTRDLNLPTRHPMNLGYDVQSILQKADVVLVLDNDVPWLPSLGGPRLQAKIIHMSSDPLASRYPFREFESDLLITGETVASLRLLNEALSYASRGKTDIVSKRAAVIGHLRDEQAQRRQAMLARARNAPRSNGVWITHCLNAIISPDAIVVNELGFNGPDFIDLDAWGGYMATSLAGGLGFGLGAALGAKLAAREREVVVCCGEGSYMFGNPTPYHFVQAAEQLPTLTIISNNHAWHAVRVAARSVYPDGAAAKSNDMPLTSLAPSPAYEKIVEAIGGYGEKVESPSEVPDAIKRALAAVRSGTPAVLNILTEGR